MQVGLAPAVMRWASDPTGPSALTQVSRGQPLAGSHCGRLCLPLRAAGGLWRCAGGRAGVCWGACGARLGFGGLLPSLCHQPRPRCPSRPGLELPGPSPSVERPGGAGRGCGCGCGCRCLGWGGFGGPAVCLRISPVLLGQLCPYSCFWPQGAASSSGIFCLLTKGLTSEHDGG